MRAVAASPAAGSPPPPSTAAIVRRLEEEARTLLHRRFPGALYTDLSFDADVWVLNHRETPRQQRVKHARFVMTDGAPFPADASSVLKAWVVSVCERRSRFRSVALVCRALLEAAAEHGIDFSTPHAWLTQLRPAHLDAAEEYMIARMTATTVFGRVVMLRKLVRWLVANGLIAAFDWTPKTSYPGQHRYRSPEGAARRASRLPSRATIQGLATIYHEHATTVADRLIICAIGLLLTTGLRIGELLTLPCECLVRERTPRGDRIGIRHWLEKSRAGSQEEAVRWLSPLGGQLAAQLLEEIWAITAPGRKLARALQEDPNRVAIPFGAPDHLSLEEVAAVLGVQPKTVYARQYRQGRNRLESVGSDAYGRPIFPRSAVEAEALRLRGSLVVFRAASGVEQLLADSLFVVSRGVLSLDSPTPASVVLATSLMDFQIRRFLSGLRARGETKHKSAFERFGIYEPDGDAAGAPCAMSPHMARHWLNTVANKSGMSAYQITRWMHRSSLKQTAVYLHAASDIADITRGQMRSGDMWGEAVDTYEALTGAAKEKFLASTIIHAHPMRIGRCVVPPGPVGCDRDKRCVLGCPWYLRVVGDEIEEAGLRDMRTRFEAAIQHTDELAKKGVSLAPAVTASQSRWIAGIDRALAATRPDRPNRDASGRSGHH